MPPRADDDDFDDFDDFDDVADFADFYRAEHPRVVRFVRTLGGSADEAFSAAQDAFVKTEPVFAGLRDPRAWVRRVAHNCFVDLVRARRAAADVQQAMTLPALRHREPSYELEHAYFVGWLLKRLADLPPRQREVLAWTIDGYEPREIAELLGVDVSRVRSNLSQARRKIQDLMKADGLAVKPNRRETAADARRNNPDDKPADQDHGHHGKGDERHDR